MAKVTWTLLFASDQRKQLAWKTLMTDNAALYAIIVRQLTKQCQVDLRARAVNPRLAIPQNRAGLGLATTACLC